MVASAIWVRASVAIASLTRDSSPAWGDAVSALGLLAEVAHDRRATARQATLRPECDMTAVPRSLMLPVSRPAPEEQ